jgi:hypothetical protein
MTEHNEDPVADIAWMRRLAEENAEAPMQGAPILMAAGLTYSAGSLAFWAELTGMFRVPGIFGVSWLAATALFLAILTFNLTGARRRTGVMTAANRAIGTVWSAVGIGIFALFVALIINDVRVGASDGFNSFWLAPSVIMVFYGLGWAVTSAMMKSRPLWMLAMASFVAAPLLALLAGQAEQYLGYAAALFLLMALPGWLLMRQARA